MLRSIFVALLLATPVLAADANKLLRDNYPVESLRLGDEGTVGSDGHRFR